MPAQNDTKHYKISDVANLLNVSQNVIRNWESEHQIEVPRNHKNHRVYTQKEINTLKNLQKKLNSKSTVKQNYRKQQVKNFIRNSNKNTALAGLGAVLFILLMLNFPVFSLVNAGKEFINKALEEPINAENVQTAFKSSTDVLGERDQVANYVFEVSIPTNLGDQLTVEGPTTFEDTVTAGNVTLTGVGSLSGLTTIDTATQTTLETTLTLAGDITGPINANEITAGAVDADALNDELTYDGTLEISGTLNLAGELEADGETGSSGQVLTSTGSSVEWANIDADDADTLDGFDSLQFLRSDTSDSYTSGTLSFSDGTFLDLSSIVHNDTAAQGLKLPQNTTLSEPASGEGYLAYDTDADKIYIYNGSSWSDVSGATTPLQEAYDNGPTVELSAGSGDLRIYNDASTEVLFLDESNGRVGIGTTSPSTKLHVVGDITVSGTVDGKDIATNAAMLNEAETISANWVNTANPWADNEIVDSLTISASGSIADGALSSNVSLLGQTIETGEITDDTILEADLDLTNAPSDDYILSYDQTSGGFTWVVNDGGTGSSKWTDSGTLTYLTDTSDDLGVGGTDATSNLYFDTSASALTLNPFGTSSGNTGELRLVELAANGTNYTGFKSPDSLGGNVIYTLPTADGSSNQVLATDSSGTLSWIDVSSGSGATSGDITAVGSVTSGDAFAGTSADDDWLGLGASAGRIEFDDQTTDEINILSAYLGIGTTTPTSELHVVGDITVTGTVDGKDIATNAAMLNEAETISANWVNTANPWADNEVADDLTISSSGSIDDGALSTNVSLLGQTIETGEITDSTILEVDLSSTNGPIDNYILSYDNTSGGFTWVDSTTAGAFDGSGTANYTALWSDSNTLTASSIYETGGQIGIGTTDPSNTLSVTGTLGVTATSSASSSRIDTTDTNFSNGTHSQTTSFGSGTDGSVQLAEESVVWSSLEENNTGSRINSDFLLEDSSGNLYWSYVSNDGHAYLYRSTDNGTSWNLQKDINAGFFVYTNYLLEDSSGNLYWSFGGGDDTASLYRSTDNGSTWSLQESITAGNTVRGIYLLEDSSGNLYWSFGSDDDNAYLYRSTDGGVNWSSQETVATTTGTWGVMTTHLLKDSSGNLYWSFGNNSDTAYLYRSTDGGSTWSSQKTVSTGYRVQADHLFEDSSGDLYWTFGDNNNSYLYRSTDGGSTWNPEETIVLSGSYVNANHLFEDSSGDLYWSFGDSDYAYLYRSTDGGSTWSSQETINTGSFEYVLSDQLLEDSTGNLYWTFGSFNGNAYLYSSADGGSTWASEETIAMGSDVHNIHLLETSTGDLYWSMVSTGGAAYLYGQVVSYYSSGTFTSRVLNTNQQPSYTTLEFSDTEPTNTEVKYQLRSASTEVGVSGATWYGPTGTTDYYTSSATNINSVHDNDQYIQYKAIFSATDVTSTPVTNSVTVNYSYNSSLLVDSTGNLGIGVSPSAALDVGSNFTVDTSGNITVAGTSTLSDSLIFSGVSTDITTTSGDLTLSPTDALNITLGGQTGDDFNIDSGGLMYKSSNNRVGIGTTSPSTQLHITGNLTIGGDGLYMGTNTSGHLLVADGTNYNPVAMSGDINIDSTGTASIQADVIDWSELSDTMTLDATTTIDMDTNTADLNFDNGTLYIDNAGQIGIGTTAPSSILDVVGNITVSGTVDGKDIATNAAMLNEAETISANWVNTANPWADNEVADDLTISASGSVADGALSSNVSLLGQTIETGEITDDTILEADLDLTNTPTDNYMLTYDNTSGGFTWVDPSTAGPIDGSGTANYIPLWSDSDTLTSSSIYETGGQIGIGTTNPSSKLQVAGNILPATDDSSDLGSNSLRWQDLYLGPSTLHIGTSTSDEYAISYDTTNNFLGFNVNGSGNDEIVFDSSGYLGIGTTSPTNALEVAGRAYTTNFTMTNGANNGYVLQSDATGASSWIDPSTLDSGTVDGLEASQFLRSDTSDSYTSGTLDFSDGTFLDLSAVTHNDTAPQGFILPQNTTLSSPSSGEGYLAYDTDDDEVYVYNGSSWTALGGGLWTQNGSDIYFDTGSVGIGVTSPNAFLDILGTTEQLRLSYDASNYSSFTVDSSGNLTISDSGTDVATFGEIQTSFETPTSFNSSGDVSIANDLLFSNQTASYIKSNAPLTIEAGESFENNNLSLKTYGTGNIVADLSGTGYLNLTGTDTSILFNTTTDTDTDYWMGVIDDAGNDDDDIFSIGDGSTPGSNNFLSIDTSGQVGIGTTSPNAKLDVAGNIFPSADDSYDLGSNSFRWQDLYLGPSSLHIGTSTSDEYVMSYNTTNNFLGFNVNGSGNSEIVFDSNGNIGIGNTNPTSILDIDAGNTKEVTFTSDLSGGARSSSLFTLSQANDGTNDSSSPLLTLSQLDTGSSTSALSIEQDASSTVGSAIGIDITGGSATGVDMPFISGSNQTAINIGIISGSGASGIKIASSSLNSGYGISFGGSTVGGSLDPFTGSMIDIDTSRDYNGTGSLEDTGNFLSMARTSENSSSGTYTISGDLATFSSDCNQVSGTCTDTSNILDLNQQYANASGAVLNILNSGTGNLATLDASNANANGLSLDIQSSSSSQYALNITSNNGATNGLYVRADGNVGIGTTNPSSKLQVAGNILPVTDDSSDLGSNSLRWQDLYLGPSTLHIGTSTSDEYAISYDTTNNFLGFSVNGGSTNEVIFNSSGEIGVGTTDPQETLDISGGLSITGQGTPFGGGGGRDGLQLGYLSDEGYVRAQMNSLDAGFNDLTPLNLLGSDIIFQADSDDSATEVARINSSGYLGIGTTNPQTYLHLFDEGDNGSVTEISRLARATSGTALDNVGVFQSFYLEDDAGSLTEAGRLNMIGRDVSSGNSFAGEFSVEVERETFDDMIEVFSAYADGSNKWFCGNSSRDNGPDCFGFTIGSGNVSTFQFDGNEVMYWRLDGGEIDLQAESGEDLAFTTLGGTKTINFDQGNDGSNLFIAGDGNIGIGDTNPSFTLTVDHNGDGANVAYVNDSNAWTNGSADYAEFFYTDDTDLESGEVVCIDTSNNNAVVRCKNAADNNVMGIISTSPAFLGNAPAEERREDNPNYKIVAMLGQIPAKVTSENGKIKIGDSLTPAKTPGHIMKANPGESTVAVALESFDGNTGTIQVMISRRNKSLTVESVEQEVTERIAQMEIEDEVSLMVSENMEKYETLLGMDADIATLQNDFGLLEGTQNNIQNRISRVEELLGLNETEESTESSESFSTLAGLTNLVTEMETIFNEFKEFTEALGLSQTTDEEGNNVLAVNSDLNVTGDTTLSDVNITGDLMAGLLKIDSIENSINISGPNCITSSNDTLCDTQTLHLQKNLAGNVDILDGLVVINPGGTVKIDGTLEAEKVLASEISIKESGQTLGSSSIPSNETQIEIVNANVTENSKVFITPTTSTGGQSLIVDSKQNGRFIVKLDNSISQNIEFDWWIVNVE